MFLVAHNVSLMKHACWNLYLPQKKKFNTCDICRGENATKSDLLTIRMEL